MSTASFDTKVNVTSSHRRSAGDGNVTSAFLLRLEFGVGDTSVASGGMIGTQGSSWVTSSEQADSSANDCKNR